MADSSRRGDDPTKTHTSKPPSKRPLNEHHAAHEGRVISLAAGHAQQDVAPGTYERFLEANGAPPVKDVEPAAFAATTRTTADLTADPYKISDGWFLEVFGRRVLKRDLDFPGMDAFNYKNGHPIGVLEHGTWGCRGDQTENSVDRGYVILNFSVDQDGTIYQYTPLFRGAWHAHEAGETLAGIEHVMLPGTCELTRIQRSASVALNAAIVLAVKDLAKYDIKLVHGDGSLGKSVFLEHIDGAIPERREWNPAVHCDNPITVWGGGRPANDHDMGWESFLHDIGVLVNDGGAPPEEEEEPFMALTDKEQAELYAVTMWTMRGANNQDPPAKDLKVDGVDVATQAKNAWDHGQLERKAAGLGTKTK